MTTTGTSTRKIDSYINGIDDNIILVLKCLRSFINIIYFYLLETIPLDINTGMHKMKKKKKGRKKKPQWEWRLKMVRYTALKAV